MNQRKIPELSEKHNTEVKEVKQVKEKKYWAQQRGVVSVYGKRKLVGWGVTIYISSSLIYSTDDDGASDKNDLCSDGACGIRSDACVSVATNAEVVSSDADAADAAKDRAATEAGADAVDDPGNI
ncbi:uncharacterized protein MONOS_12290 [Monocercomonoides exilis]|uniref:uncharacterized protein n=1 Tax=Monocercomonoides exilis TaxID=2049356 RepID=UPI00355A5CF6|nr:hypothetical protein MONOS_12290 [Monocercomonoides exilis]|eukprot:MONOS_12290.1-p1 / transcript=MONOS_12290.1 / gene=MONOS_12290 / organism=Monocercomonoides_exilis_PA203 / gene_product=unspecified product / transcript_product=unspecified product / location=Mono_scaffold00671:10892-11898(-) / protein_length=125 / sequence_SO=supercontig / SO=protein_coding / is_pseudo=false